MRKYHPNQRKIGFPSNGFHHCPHNKYWDPKKMRIRSGLQRVPTSTYLLIPTTDHWTDRKITTSVVEHDVCEHLWSSSNTHSFLVSQLKQSCPSSQLSLPERTVSRSSSHGSQEVRVNFNDLLHALWSWKTIHLWDEKDLMRNESKYQCRNPWSIVNPQRLQYLLWRRRKELWYHATF